MGKVATADQLMDRLFTGLGGEYFNAQLENVTRLSWAINNLITDKVPHHSMSTETKDRIKRKLSDGMLIKIPIRSYGQDRTLIITANTNSSVKCPGGVIEPTSSGTTHINFGSQARSAMDLTRWFDHEDPKKPDAIWQEGSPVTLWNAIKAEMRRQTRLIGEVLTEIEDSIPKDKTPEPQAPAPKPVEKPKPKEPPKAVLLD
jgi:hypothetical protein